VPRIPNDLSLGIKINKSITKFINVYVTNTHDYNKSIEKQSKHENDEHKL